MIISDLLAAFLFLTPIATTIIYGRMAWRAHCELHGWRYARMTLPHGRRMIGFVLATVSFANIWTGEGFWRLIGHEVGLDIIGGAILVRLALLLGAAYVQIRYAGA